MWFGANTRVNIYRVLASNNVKGHRPSLPYQNYKNEYLYPEHKICHVASHQIRGISSDQPMKNGPYPISYLTRTKATKIICPSSAYEPLLTATHPLSNKPETERSTGVWSRKKGKLWLPLYKQLQLLCNQQRLVLETTCSWGLHKVWAKHLVLNQLQPGSLALCKLKSRNWLRNALMLPRLLVLPLPLLLSSSQ